MEIYDVCRECGEKTTNKKTLPRMRYCPRCGDEKAVHIQTTDKAEADKLHGLIFAKSRYWKSLAEKQRRAEDRKAKKAAQKAEKSGVK